MNYQEENKLIRQKAVNLARIIYEDLRLDCVEELYHADVVAEPGAKAFRLSHNMVSYVANELHQLAYVNLVKNEKYD